MLFYKNFLFLFLINQVFGQVNNDFKNLILPEKKGIKIFLKQENNEYERVYLGEIKSEDNRILFYVVNEFRTVQAAIQKIGHSRIIFLKPDKSIAGMYYLNAPEDLPVRIENDKLIFCNKNPLLGKMEMHTFKIKSELPKFLCMRGENKDCYLKEFQ